MPTPDASLTFFVPGRAIPAGSKRAFAWRDGSGRTHAGVEDVSGRSGKEWRAAIRMAASLALRVDGRASMTRPPADGPLALTLTFYTPRPAGHYGKRGLRPGAPARPTTRPDVLKLARAVEDACTGILWRDDSQIVDEFLTKRFADDHGIGVVITVDPADVTRRAPADAPQLVLATVVDDPADGYA
jgi:Holliday junction resolvase RusA-like endonuclease